jgi:alpha-D-xyloside xylohydrolase
MKFNNGYWLLRDGATARYATQAFDTRTDESSASVAVLCHRIESRGSVLNTPTITVDLSSPMPGVVRVVASHFRPIAPPSVAFELAKATGEVQVERTNDRVRLTSGPVTAEADIAGPWALTFTGDDEPLTGSGFKSLGSMSVAGDGDYMVERLSLPIGAHVYGFGERFTPFVKNGQTVDTWNEDGGTASEQAYKSIPFFLTDAGFGVLVNSPGRVSFEVASEVVSAVQFSVPGQVLDYLVIYGPTPAEILERYTALTGRPALPPRWSFGLWLSTSFTTDYDEQTVSGFVDGMAERELPLSVLHYDCYWMRPLHWCDFEWDRDTFPDPEGMLTRMGDRGLHRSVWINPYIGQRSPLFTEAADAGYLVRRADGTVWQWDMWVAGMGLVDFTNPAARDWYADKVRTLLHAGVDTVKTDFGERIPTDVVWHDGSDPALMHNYYAFLYNRTVFEAVREVRGEHQALVFARSASVGSQQFPVHWGGDCESTYVAMAESLRAGLSLGLSGFGFWSHDIGGFEGTPSPTLFKRWVAFGLLSSHSRLHGSGSYRVPWLFDDEAVDVTRRFTRLKNSLMPYLWACAVAAHERGLPVMRAMVLEFPQDPGCAALDQQYMLGPDLLVAPVFDDRGRVDVYVPEGTWTDYFDGSAVTGPRWVRQQRGAASLPLLVRPGAVVPLGSRADRPDYDDALAPTFEVFALADGETRLATLHGDSGAARVTVEVRRTGQVLSARVVAGLDQMAEGWALQWVTGPQGNERGPLGRAAAGQQRLEIRLPD